MSYVEAEALLLRLPMESAYLTDRRNALSDDELAEIAELSGDAPHGPWTREASLLAALIDAQMVLINVQLARGGAETKPVEPIRRPGVAGRAKPRLNPDATAYLDRIRQDLIQRRQAEGAS